MADEEVRLGNHIQKKRPEMRVTLEIALLPLSSICVNATLLKKSNLKQQHAS